MIYGGLKRCLANHMSALQMFEPTKEIDGQFYKATRRGNKAQNGEVRNCQIGRIVTACKYMNDPKVQERLVETIKAIDAVL